MRNVVLLLHILSAAAWLGAAMWVPGDVRRTLARGRPYVDGLAARVTSGLRLDIYAGIATVITGLGVQAFVGGHPRAGIMVGFVAAFVRLGVVWGAMVPAWRAVEARILSGGDLTPAMPAAGRLAMLSGIAHALWVIALAGMIF